MGDKFLETWQDVYGTVSPVEQVPIFATAMNLAVGGLLAVYLRFLYGKFGAAATDSDSITRVFPLLTIVTTVVIALVQSSLALSLGLVGALSIVRFRAAIKEPEELVYLFLCIAVGLSLGAYQPVIAFVLVGVATVFVCGMHFAGSGQRQQKMVLTITGDADQYFSRAENGILETLRACAGRCSILRLDIEQGQGQVRVALPGATTSQIEKLIVTLRGNLPGCEFSYVDLRTAV